MAFPLTSVRDLASQVEWGQLCITPLDPGIWALLEPAGSQNHAPQLCWVTPDLLACVWMAGGQEGTSGMGIVLSLLAASSGRWTEPQLVSQDPARSEQNPLLYVAGEHLHLVHTAQRSRSLDEPFWESGSSFSMQWTAQLRHQSLPLAALDPADPASWGPGAWSRATTLLEQPAFCRHPPLQRADGRWLLPIYRSLETGGSFGHDHSQVLLLEADGTAVASALDEELPSVDPITVPESTGRVHGSIVPSADGSGLLQFFRSRLADRMYLSRSGPEGEQWTAPEPIQLPNNNSSIQALRLASGRLAMIYNRFCFEPDPESPQPWGEANWPRTRWPLSIALSTDDGQTWPWIRDIDTGLGFCGSANWQLNGQLAYPTILEGQPGELHIAYSWAGRAAIRYLCLEEDEILGVVPALEGS
ncbi:exo-alpha-sialidase [Cyanobium sp. Aljojuca 7D2]|uniref:exo-alpha-sialidase n=1 Tax=Cyanobium sp. Aljojuca 7D2 TaxID=2823698 RepID=UPI0020CD1785|nr:exo-alpha-sialidase [Cyanobium sp. Aljojuca 7D2]MCP9891969.1 exo-alpha-sialidase [Cyanobium sp. Aljojuca 7D2]